MQIFTVKICKFQKKMPHKRQHHFFSESEELAKNSTKKGKNNQEPEDELRGFTWTISHMLSWKEPGRDWPSCMLEIKERLSSTRGYVV